MDAQAHLISLGWAGPGHALDSRPQYKQKGHRGLAYNPALDPLKVGNTGNGLVKPLSISKRKDRFGIGKKSDEPASGTEWWLKGFESALGNIGKSESERSGTSTPIMGSGSKHAGLYGFFIKGQVMEGTISKEIARQVRGRKRKSDVLETDDDDALSDWSSEGRARARTRATGLEVSPVRRKAETVSDFAAVGAFVKERDKQDKRRNNKHEAGTAIQQFSEVGKFLEAAKGAKGSKKEKKKRKSEALFQDVEDDGMSTTIEGHTRPESKVERRERRERRRQRREKREMEKSLLKGKELGLTKDRDTSNDETKRATTTAVEMRRPAKKP